MILIQFDSRISTKLHCTEYVIETTGRPGEKLKKILHVHVIRTVKHTYKAFTFTGRKSSKLIELVFKPSVCYIYYKICPNQSFYMFLTQNQNNI